MEISFDEKIHKIDFAYVSEHCASHETKEKLATFEI